MEDPGSHRHDLNMLLITWTELGTPKSQERIKQIVLDDTRIQKEKGSVLFVSSESLASRSNE